MTRNSTMQTLTFLRWTLHHDPDATRRAHGQVPEGGAEACACDPCRNFVALRNQVYPPRVLQLFRDLGLETNKETEVMHVCRLPDGRHAYSGWFHLVGKLVDGEPCWDEVDGTTRQLAVEPVTSTFSMGFSLDRSMASAMLEGLPVVQLEFYVELPWVVGLAEPEF